MLYITEEELSLLCPQVSLPTNTTKKRGYIYLASQLADGATGRSEFGLQIRNVYNAQIPMDLNITGILPHTPFKEWNSASAIVSVPGTTVSINVNTSDFSVNKDTGIIKYQRNISSGTWPRTFEPDSGAWSDVITPYHSGSLYQIDGNEFPYELNASFRAGFFTIVGITSTGAPSGSTDVIVEDITDIDVGQEFYFDVDVTNDPLIDKRIITDVNKNTNVVAFTPKLGYNLAGTAKFRRIDKAVRLAVGIIISDLITHPPNTVSFSKNLGRSALVKSWLRATKRSIPPAALELLAAYMR